MENDIVAALHRAELCSARAIICELRALLRSTTKVALSRHSDTCTCNECDNLRRTLETAGYSPDHTRKELVQ